MKIFLILLLAALADSENGQPTKPVFKIDENYNYRIVNGVVYDFRSGNVCANFLAKMFRAEFANDAMMLGTHVVHGRVLQIVDGGILVNRRDPLTGMVDKYSVERGGL